MDVVDLVDTHCHLNLSQFDKDRPEVMFRAHESGINHIIVPGVDLETSRQAVSLSQSHSNVYAAVGVHPNEAGTFSPEVRTALQLLCQDNGVIAVGEIGLDYYRDRTPKALQMDSLWELLILAAEVNKPVILHNRAANDDFLPLIDRWLDFLAQHNSSLLERPGVFHSFEGTIDTARFICQRHFMMGINGTITYPKNTDLQQTIRLAPRENILLETDAPYLSPHPQRGKRNEPANISIVNLEVSRLLGCDPGEIGKITTRNARSLFRWNSNL